MSTWPPPPPREPGHTPWQPEPCPAQRPLGHTQRVVMESRPDWLAERMLDQRIVTLTGKLDEADVNQAAASLALLDASGDEPVQLRLSDVDADLDTALTLLDTLDLMTVPVHASCLGQLTGAAVVLPAVADHRTATRHATIHLREPRTEHSGVAREIAAHAEEHRRRLDSLQERIATACSRSTEAVAADMRDGRVLTADEARGYGLIDHVAGGVDSSR